MHWHRSKFNFWSQKLIQNSLEMFAEIVLTIKKMTECCEWMASVVSTPGRFYGPTWVLFVYKHKFYELRRQRLLTEVKGSQVNILFTIYTFLYLNWVTSGMASPLISQLERPVEIWIEIHIFVRRYGFFKFKPCLTCL